MKNLKGIILCSTLAFMMTSCGMLSKNKQGCGTNGKNVGAEKILSGEGPKKSPKFRA